MATGQLIFQPPKFDWHNEDPTNSIWRVERPSCTSPWSIQHGKERWYATIVGFLGIEGFKWWNTLPISKNENDKKDPEAVLKAITDTLEVSTSYWNHIDEMYSDIKQGEHDSTDQLDQCIKELVERCQYSTEDEKMVLSNQSWFSMQQSILKSKYGSDKRKRERMSHI